MPARRFLPKNEGSAKAIDACFSILLDEKSNLIDCPLPRKFRSFKLNVNTDPSDELNEGGKIIAEGTPEDIAKNNESYTGHYLKRML